MLIPLTRKKFEQLIPLSATSPQYNYYWGKLPDFLRRLLVSIVGCTIALVLEIFFGKTFTLPIVVFGGSSFLYWLWGPVFWATLRNVEIRKLPYSGFWRGEVLDIFISEELIGKEETVNKRGELVIVENRERRINLVVGDESGFTMRYQAPLQRNHQAIKPGLAAEMLVMSYAPDLSDITESSDIYIPNRNIWVSNYPYLQRDAFVEVSRKLKERELKERELKEKEQERPRQKRSRRSSRQSSGQSSRRRRAMVDDY